MISGILFYIALLLVLFFLVGFLKYATLKVTENAWREFVTKHPDLLLIKGSAFSLPRVTGQYKGFEYSLFTLIKEISNKKVETYTIIEMSLPLSDNVCHFNIYYNDVFSRIGDSITGVKGVATGDSVFDDVFVLLSETPGRIKEIFTPELRSFLLEREGLINISLYGSKLTYERPGLLRKVEDVLFVSEAMYRMARSVCAVNGLKEPGEKKPPSQTYQCLHCGAVVPPENKFCINCGS